MPRSENPILQELRENYIYARDYWAPTREQGGKDIKYQTEGPWEADEIADRTGRVTLSLDELNQYLNQITNEFRQSQRSVKVNPRGEGADDQTALIRGGMIREIEYQSKAQQAYVTAGDNMVRRSYGYFKLITDWAPGTFNRVIRIVRVANPDVIYLDPDAKEADWSDGNFAFEIEDGIKESDFRRRFGKKATITDFNLDSDSPAVVGGWVTGDQYTRRIRVASYWRRACKENPLYLLENGQVIDPRDFEDGRLQLLNRGDQRFAILEGQPYEIKDERPDNEYTVTKHLTNGLEILETTPENFDEIPVIPMFGREVWVTNAGKSTRKFLSAVRMARDAYKAYCYARSAMVERLAQDPKTPYEGWQGQFDTQSFGPGKDPTKNPQMYVEFKIIESESGAPVLDKPSRNLTEPQIAQYELASESFRRSIQAAMGGSPLPTSAQRQNEKSGVALRTIEQSADQGNFHFIDAYDRALERAGRMMDSALDIVYDTAREVGMRDESGKYSTLQINQRDAAGQPIGFHTNHGDHGVTISTGPSYQSQRDAADDFLDKLAQNPEVFPRIADLVVKLKNLGPIGDQISQRLAPPGADLPPQVAAQLQQGQQLVAQLQEEIRQLKAGDAIKKYTVDEQEKTKRVLGLIKVDQQDAENRLDAMLGAIGDKLDRMHEQYTQAAQHLHERQQAAEAAANAQAQQNPAPAEAAQ